MKLSIRLAVAVLLVLSGWIAGSAQTTISGSTGKAKAETALPTGSDVVRPAVKGHSTDS
jgi:hypothetical protein